MMKMNLAHFHHHHSLPQRFKTSNYYCELELASETGLAQAQGRHDKLF